MKIISIEAENFRTLKSINLKFKDGYCAISGKNNAGKSAIIKIIQHFFDQSDDERVYFGVKESISFARDATQWDDVNSISVSIEVQLNKKDDSEVFFLVNTLIKKQIEAEDIIVKLTQSFSKDGSSSIICKVEGDDVEGREASEILKKFRSASNLVVHNSTTPSKNLYYLRDSITEIMEAYFSPDDRKKISEAEKGVQTRIKNAAKVHKNELEKLLGKLNEKYQVELSTIDRSISSRIPLVIKLTDKSVEVPLRDWGSGTQNRTRILMSILDVVRIRSSSATEDRSTPIFLVEEPESFLHPSAQAEFGQVLNGLAKEFNIQIIATTHSPYMLNQTDPSANILLERNIIRNLLRETVIKDTSGEDWMLPFSENLGIIPSEFTSWRPIIGANANKIILVEGDIDKEYFEFYRDRHGSIYKIPSDVEIIPYGGSGALTNSQLLQFMIKRFRRVFITFDLDAKKDVEKTLKSIRLIEEKDFLSIGLDAPGDDCIEGLLPKRIKKVVFGDNTDLVCAISSQDNKARSSAKNELKKKLLEAFKNTTLLDSDHVEFEKIFTTIAKNI